MKNFIIICLLIMLASCSIKKKENAEIAIIPEPALIEYKTGTFDFNDSIQVFYKKDVEKSNYVIGFLETILKTKPVINENEGQKENLENAIIFKVVDTIADEGYVLDIQKEKITLSASKAAGWFYGLQTLKQLIDEKNQKIPCTKIYDEPRFTYRGMHLDVCRHFYPADFVKKYIDLLALHKMNYLHWHLTEDQGWRIEIKGYEKLTKIGSQRKQTMVGKNWDKFDGQPYGGYYTQEEIREIVEYAASRFITIVPEIEMPGHSLAALASYPELGCTGGSYEVATTWGVFDDVFCAGNEKTFEFLEDVIDQVCELFPGPYIHIGGDECPKTHWKECPKCQKRIKDEGLADETELQSYFVRRMEKYINSKGKTIIGWDEILEGGLAENAVVMSWRGEKGGVEAAELNHLVIMTPNDVCYFDHYQDSAIENEPLAIGGLTTIEDAYSYEPIPKDLKNDKIKYILGAQANVWTEYIVDEKQLEYMVLPRMTALSEVLWSKPENKDWDNFLKRLDYFRKQYKNMNVNYAKHVFKIDG